jgi:hypothetical protein
MIIKNVESAWQNDSFYVKTISRNAASIFKEGIFGCLAGRITRVVSSRGGATFLVAYRTSDIFIQFIENRFVKDRFMSDANSERDIRSLAKLTLSTILAEKVISLTGVESLRLLPLIKFWLTVIVIDVAFKKIAHAFFP